jgi:hypothetical protein
MNPTVIIVMLLAMLVLSFHFDRRRRERDSRAEDISVAAGFKRWLVGSHDEHAEMPHPLEKAPQTLVRVRGSLPPGSWSTLATALVASLPSDAHVTAAVDVSFAIDANRAPAVTGNLNSLISELELSDLRVARIDPPRKFVKRRVVIRFKNLSPRMQALLCVNR